MCCVVCVIEYGWYIGRGDCGVCGWKDRCRDGNLRTYCHVSPILFGWFFVEASPTCFCIFVKCFFCNLFPGIFLGKRAFLGLHSLSTNFFNVLPATCFCCFLGVREIICCGSAQGRSHRYGWSGFNRTTFQGTKSRVHATPPNFASV